MKERLVAHRGFTRLYPENTLASVKAALRLGLKWVEIDVQLTSDGVPVLYHDSRMWRVSGTGGDIRSRPWAEVRRLPASEPRRLGAAFAGERVASLSQLARAFARSQRARLFVELKEESLDRFGRMEVLAAVAKALIPIRRRIVLISFDEEVLRLARLSTPYPLGLVLRLRSQLKSAFMREVKPEFIFCNAKKLPWKGSLRLKNARQCIYEVPDPAEGRALIARGVDLIETFAPDNYLLRK